MALGFDFGVETERDPDVWTDKVRDSYVLQLKEGDESPTLPDHLFWSMPAFDLDPLLAARGIRLANENRDGHTAIFIEPNSIETS